MKVFPKSAINGLTKLLASYRFSSTSSQVKERIDQVRDGMGLRWDSRVTRTIDDRAYDSEVYHFEKPRKITAEQSKLGKAWLKEYFFKKDGTTRSGKRTESIEQAVLDISKNVTRFEFIGVISFCNWFGDELAYGPIYRTFDKFGNYFDYSPVHWGQPIITDVVLTNTPKLKLVKGA